MNSRCSCLQHQRAGITGLHHCPQQKILEDIKNLEDQKLVNNILQEERSYMQWSWDYLKKNEEHMIYYVRLCMCEEACIHAYIFVCTHISISVCTWQWPEVNVEYLALSFSTFILIQNLSLNLGLANSTKLAGQQVPDCASPGRRIPPASVLIRGSALTSSYWTAGPSLPEKSVQLRMQYFPLVLKSKIINC